MAFQVITGKRGENEEKTEQNLLCYRSNYCFLTLQLQYIQIPFLKNVFKKTNFTFFVAKNFLLHVQQASHDASKCNFSSVESQKYLKTKEHWSNSASYFSPISRNSRD